ncbi:hypothetical protein [Aureispira anguillae]|nr:hypothetical protein [Aureispira anguillae]
MKFFIIVFFAFVFSSNLSAQATASANETITVSNISTINLDLDSDNIEIKETKGSRVIIESHITLETINNTTLLEFLVNSGRYALKNEADASTQTLTITRKKVSNVLLIKGEECKETVRYVVLVPASVKFVNTSSSTASIK